MSRLLSSLLPPWLSPWARGALVAGLRVRPTLDNGGRRILCRRIETQAVGIEGKASQVKGVFQTRAILFQNDKRLWPFRGDGYPRRRIHGPVNANVDLAESVRM